MDKFMNGKINNKMKDKTFGIIMIKINKEVNNIIINNNNKKRK